MFFASSFLIIPKKKLNENNRQKKAKNEFIIRPHIFIRDFRIQAKMFFYIVKETKLGPNDWSLFLIETWLKKQKHTFESASLRLTKQYFIRFILVL